MTYAESPEAPKSTHAKHTNSDVDRALTKAELSALEAIEAARRCNEDTKVLRLKKKKPGAAK